MKWVHRGKPHQTAAVGWTMALSDGQIMTWLVALSFLPPVLFLLWIRAHEKHDREPFRAVLVVFAWGGSAGVAIALLLHTFFEAGFHRVGGPLPAAGISTAFLAAVVIAPIVEEFAKALGLGLARRRMVEVEDGIIYGAAVGLGFAATENFVYGLTALAAGGFNEAVLTISVRVFSSMLLHGSASAIIGYGYGLAMRRGGVAFEALPHYIGAVLLHAAYNFLVGTQATWGFVAALLLVAFLTGFWRRRIRELDALPHDRSAIR